MHVPRFIYSALAIPAALVPIAIVGATRFRYLRCTYEFSWAQIVRVIAILVNLNGNLRRPTTLTSCFLLCKYACHNW